MLAPTECRRSHNHITNKDPVASDRSPEGLTPGLPSVMTKAFNCQSRRFPDVITPQLVAVLSGGAALGFAALCEIMAVKLRATSAGKGGPEMLRLRLHEKLHALVIQGRVEQHVTESGKEYRGSATLTVALPVVA